MAVVLPALVAADHWLRRTAPATRLRGRVAGAAACNRFFGSATISADSIALGALGSTKMACPEPIMEQEKRYLEALGNATRFAVEGKTLSIWTKGTEKPLTFTRETP